MATSARVVLNRRALDAVRLGVADGLFSVAKQIVETARPPSDVGTETAAESAEEKREKRPPLDKAGGAAAWVDGKKVAGFGLDGRQPDKPRALKLAKPGITAVAGFGFPGRFTELGTIHEAPHPFLTPAMGEVLPDAARTLRGSLARFLNGLP